MTDYLPTGWTSGRKGAMKEPGACRECGVLFKKRGPNQKYCSSSCMRKWNHRKRNKPMFKTCPRCQKEFEVSGPYRYCYTKECIEANFVQYVSNARGKKGALLIAKAIGL